MYNRKPGPYGFGIMGKGYACSDTPKVEMMSKPMRSDEAAAYISTSRAYLRTLALQGKIPSYRPDGGRAVYFRAEDLEAYCFAKKSMSADEANEAAEKLTNGRGS
ncbi:hypothetical protein FACS1894137_11850 [Spirochaetia bacterium]|nr:hypothetical protein FACS1894137_11850 [Spirochaetia bacterium]